MKYKINDIGQIVCGGTPSTTVKEYWNDEIVWLTPKDLSISKAKYTTTSSVMISQKGYQNSSAKLVPINTVLLSSRAPIGYLTIAKTELCTNQGFKAIICNEKIINHEFLYYLLQTKVEDLKAISTGSTFLELSTNTFKNYEIEVPELQEQQHIVNILGSIDDKIENNEELLSKIDSMLNTIYHKNFNKNLKNSNKYSLVPLSEIADFISGYSYKGEELTDKSDYALMTIKNFDRNTGFKLDGFKPISVTANPKQNQFVNLYDTVVAHTDLTQNAEIIGNAEILLNICQYTNIIASMDLVIVRPKNINKYLLYLLLHNSDFKSHALGYTAGTTVLHLSKKVLQDYTVCLPSSINHKIISQIENLIIKQSLILQENLKLNELKQLYLKKFFG